MKEININRKNSYLLKERRNYLEKYYKKELTNEEEKTLHSLNLSMYSRYTNYSNEFEKLLFKSDIDNDIILHPEQIECLDILNGGSDLLLSAPTSFGKTYLVLEYMYRNKANFKNILFIVPTIALRNELYVKIQKLFSDEYNIVINNFDQKEEKNIYLMLPERMEEKEFIENISTLNFDLCVIDEVYKLSEKNNDTRNIIFNKSYYIMLDNCKQLVLLGPFMKNVKFKRKGKNRDIIKYYSNYSPVFNEPHLIDTKNIDVISALKNKVELNKKNKQIIFSPTPDKLKNLILKFEYEEGNSDEFIKFLEEYYFKEWDLIRLLKNRITYHTGPLPKYLREYIEYLYNDKNSGYNVVIATSTLLEGINTPTNILHIYDIQYARSRKLNKFELNNLIGRVGRLSERVKGDIYIYDEMIFNMLDEEYAEEIIFTAETEEYKEPEEGIELEKEVTEEEFEKYEEYKQEINEQQNEEVEVEVNIKYYRRFKENIEEFKKIFETKNTSFKKQLGILQFFSQKIQQSTYKNFHYYTMLILQESEFKEMIIDKNNDEANGIILKYFKALSFIEYEMGNLISLLQLNSLIADEYKKETGELVKLYGMFHDKTNVFKTLVDIGFANFDAEIIEKNLKGYKFLNSQKLIQDVLKLEIIKELSPFGIWKINQLKINQTLQT